MSRPCLAHHRVGALDVGAETLAPGAIVTVEGKGLLVDKGEPFGHALLGFLERGARGDLGAHGVDHVVDVAPEGLEPVAAGDVTVAHDDVGEVELSEAVERRDPVLRLAVAHKGRPADDGVARDDDLLPRQVDEHVPLGVRPPEVEEVDLAVAPVELHRLLEGDRRQRRPERPDLGEIRLGEADGGLQPRALGGRPGRGEVGLELGDLVRALADVVLDPLEPLAHHGLARELVGDDLRVRVGGGVHLVAVPVVPVELRVDHVAHRLRRDLAQPFHDDAGRRGLRVCVDDGHAVVALDDRRVRVHLVGRRGDRDVHAVGDLLDLEPCVAGALSLVTAAVRHRHSSFPDSPRGAHRRASAAAARLARPRSQTRLAARIAEPPRPPLGSHDHVPSLASRRVPPSLRGRRSARTTTFPDSPRGAHRRASAAAARLARPRSQTRLAARIAEPPRPPLGSHDHSRKRGLPRRDTMRWRVRAQGCARFSCRGGRADGAETRRRPARDPDGRRRPEERGPRGRLHPPGGPPRRATQPGPWIYEGGRFWDVKYQEADELPVFDTEFGKLGLLMWSEVYVPELARAMALKGAVITLLPAGLWSSELHDTWRTLLWARAIENLMITATSRNILPGGGGHAIVCSPEEILLEARRPGVFTATVDLARVQWLREQVDRPVDPWPWRTKPGIFKQWLRPEVCRGGRP